MRVGLFNAYCSDTKKQKKSVFSSQVITFGQKNPALELPKVLFPTVPSLNPVNLPGVSQVIAKGIIELANKANLSVDAILRTHFPELLYKVTGVEPEKSITVKVGKTNVTSLIDAKQIFGKVIEFIESAEKSIQIEMFEFQNMHVDRNTWPPRGAEMAEGWELQQLILKKMIEKKIKKPDLAVQMILDTHKWNQDGYGLKRKFHNNLQMLQFLKDLKNPHDQRSARTKESLESLNIDKKFDYKGSINIDAVPYPQQQHRGGVLQHVKLLAVDSKKVMIMGMNWGTHSSANHDAGVAIETITNKGQRKKDADQEENSEVDNIIQEIFNKDWILCWERLGKIKFGPGPLSKEEKRKGFIKIVSGPIEASEQRFYNGANRIIKPENVEFARVMQELYDKPEYRQRFAEQRLDLVSVRPVENPVIKVIVNRPRIGNGRNDKTDYGVPDQYKELFGDFITGRETAGEYLKTKIKTARSMRAELFALTHKEIINIIIQRYHDSLKPGCEPFDPKVIISPDIIDSFPYTRTMHRLLIKAGVPVREYNVNTEIQQRMHAKWAVFEDEAVGQTEPELMLGSINWSAVGLEQNISTGFRKDYSLTNEFWNNEIVEKKKYGNISRFEEFLGLQSLFYVDENGLERFNFPKMLERKHDMKALKLEIDKHNGAAQVEVTDIRDKNGKTTTIQYTEESQKALRKLINLYRSAIKGVYVSGKNQGERVDERVLKQRMQKCEAVFGLESLHDGKSFDYMDMQQRMDILKPVLKAMKYSDQDAIELEDVNIALTKANGIAIQKLLGYYEEIQRINSRRNKFQRGNNECAVVIPNKALTALFRRQFDKDWEYSKPNVPEGYGHESGKSTSPPSFQGKIRILKPKPVNPFESKVKTCTFSRIV